MPHSSRCGGHQGERPGIREIFGVFGLLSWILIYITVVALPNVYTKNSHQKGGVAKWPNAFDCKSNLNVVRTFESCLLHKNKTLRPGDKSPNPGELGAYGTRSGSEATQLGDTIPRSPQRGNSITLLLDRIFIISNWVAKLSDRKATLSNYINGA